MQNKPPDRLPPLDLLAAFEAAARHLSFTKAAAERFLTQSAVSRQMRALEDDLGTALFRRQHRALALTPQGARLFTVCTAVLAQLRGTVRELRAPSQREVLALTTTPGLASFWLIPRLPAFTRAHPGIDVRLDATFEMRDLSREGFDLAIRYARAEKVAGQALFGEKVLPVCSPKLLRHLPLARPQDLAAHTLLQMEPSISGGMPVEWEPWLQAMGLAHLEPAARLSMSGYNEVVAAAVAGQGVALGRRPLVDELLREGRLVAPLAKTVVTPRSYILVVDPAARARPAVRALEAWLLEQAAQERAASKTASRATTLRPPPRKSSRRPTR
jgi:LysR family transcriptional regulator, glycine cleavage system transcriptional activator